MEDLLNLDSKNSPDLIKRLANLEQCQYHKITYHQAMELLSSEGNFEDAKIGEDLSSDMENWLTQHYPTWMGLP